MDTSKRTALTVVNSRIASSSDCSPSRLRTNATIFCPLSICLTAEYLAVPTRATHSQNSSKASTVCSEFSAAWPTPSCSARCESMKAALHVGTERRHRMWMPCADGSAVISESCSTSHSPQSATCGRAAVGSCGLRSTASHSSKLSLSSLSAESVELCSSVYHALRCGRYCVRACRTTFSRSVVVRKAAEFSRFARGRIRSLSIVESACGTGTNSSLSLTPSPSLSTHSPNLGLARQKAMRTSTLRNSYSTSSRSIAVSLLSVEPFSFAGPPRSRRTLFGSASRSWPRIWASRRPSRCWLCTAATLFAFALMNWLHMTSNL